MIDDRVVNSHDFECMGATSGSEYPLDGEDVVALPIVMVYASGKTQVLCDYHCPETGLCLAEDDEARMTFCTYFVQ